MTTQTFMVMLLVCSLLTTLTVEAIKKMINFKENKSNLIAAIVSIVLAIAVSIGYAIMTLVTINIQYIMFIIALCFLSWLCAMNGYDKVMQTLSQITGPKEKEE